MFANELRHVPLRDLDLGGWKSSQTIVQVYQHPDVEAQRTALAVAATTTPPSDEAQAGRVLHQASRILQEVRQDNGNHSDGRRVPPPRLHRIAVVNTRC
jgi:hypothetical protein